MQIPKIKKGWKELQEEVIDTNKCLYCGACGAFCENIQFDLNAEKPIELGTCTTQNTCRDGFGVCYNLCPQTGKEYFPIKLLDKWVFGNQKSEKILGSYLEIISARLKNPNQYPKLSKMPFQAGGAITGLLIAAFESKEIDCAITAKSDETYPFKPKTILAKSKEEILACSGTKPCQSPTLSLMGKTIAQEYRNIAVVGTGCQIQSLRKMQNHPRFDFESYDLVKYAIGTFCLGTYQNSKLEGKFRENKIDPTKIETIKYAHYKMLVQIAGKKVEIPENELFFSCGRLNCRECSDYSASFADISVGGIGSPEGWTTLIIRNQRGKELLDLALKKGILETQPVNEIAKEVVTSLTRVKTDIVRIEKIIEHTPDVRSIYLKNERIARSYKPGQFVVLWLPEYDFLPMSISGIQNDLLEITVLKVGDGTKALFGMKIGDELGIRGPYGNGWNIETAKNVLIVGGGIGLAGIMTVLDQLRSMKKNVVALIGSQDKSTSAFDQRIKGLGCTTFEGIRKVMGCEMFEDIIANNKIDLILTCGPEVMMKRVFDIAQEKKIEIQANLERFMKCAIGLCGSCCVGTNNDITVCKDGPVFNSKQLAALPQFNN